MPTEQNWIVVLGEGDDIVVKGIFDTQQAAFRWVAALVKAEGLTLGSMRWVIKPILPANPITSR
jgi:hypothetical protein